MNSESPGDLVVPFRSVPRRLRESQGETPDADFDRLGTELHRLIGEAGRLMGTPAEASAIADAIASTPADVWTEAQLVRLREIALALGHELRGITAAGER